MLVTICYLLLQDFVDSIWLKEKVAVIHDVLFDGYRIVITIHFLAIYQNIQNLVVSVW